MTLEVWTCCKRMLRNHYLCVLLTLAGSPWSCVEDGVLEGRSQQKARKVMCVLPTVSVTGNSWWEIEGSWEHSFYRLWALSNSPHKIQPFWLLSSPSSLTQSSPQLMLSITKYALLLLLPYFNWSERAWRRNQIILQWKILFKHFTLRHKM